jgi:hypothetical protein
MDKGLEVLRSASMTWELLGLVQRDFVSSNMENGIVCV